MLNVERTWQQRTDDEIAEEDRVREEIRRKYPGTFVDVTIRICCTAQSHTGLTCGMPPGHVGLHWVFCKDQRW